MLATAPATRGQTRRKSTAGKKLVRRVRYPLELNNVANHQFAASSGFHLTVDLNFTTLD
jgi:hypothetical protein